MKFETQLNCGDKGWTYDGSKGAVQVTVGQIRIQYTKSKGFKNGRVDASMPTIAFDNYKPKAEEYEEVYMCVETGIGSGRLYTFGKQIFHTEAECIAANEKNIKKAEAAERSANEWKRADAARRLRAAQSELAELEGK